MIRLQDIADMAGVSRTTVSNVINGNTKRVSQKTIDKITAILKEQNYVPHMGSVMLSGHGSRIIGVVLGFAQAHGMYSLQDSFVGELVGTIQMEAEMKGYYIMLIGGENIQNVVDIASRWNVEGLIILGYNDEKYRKLSRKLNKKMVLIDAYPAGEYFFQNVGVDDYSGGYQIGSYLCSCGFDKALFLAETDIDEDGNETRVYPFSEVFCHVVGLASAKTGVEGVANYELLSTSGNIINQLSDDLSGEKSVGYDVVTTLVPKLQEAAYKALGSNKGAVVAMEPSTGRVLAMVSKPDYDPNEAPEMYSEWLGYDSSDSVLLNRATQGLYSPGSTFKVLTALEYVREYPDYENYSFDCTGSAYVNGGTTIPCYNGSVHGHQDLKLGFANSCNGVFSTIGFRLNLSKYRQLCEDFYYNKNLDIGIESSVSSFTLDENSGVSEIQETGIGQGKTMVSPMHNLMIISAIANRGVMMQPYFVEKVQTRSGDVVSTTTPKQKSVVCTPSEADTIGEFCRAVVTEGTGYAFTYTSYTVAGKTGTAQFDNSDRVHSWFIGYAPYENPQISFCVILEGGYTGVPGAQQVTKALLDAFFDEY